MSASSLLNTLLRALALSAERAGCPMNLQFDSDEADSKTSGSISPGELGMIIWVCWIMSWNSRSSKCAMESEHANIPDLNHLIVSAVVSCMDNDNDVDVWNTDVCHLEAELSVGKIHTWAIRTVPNLAECFSNFINSRLKAATFEVFEINIFFFFSIAILPEFFLQNAFQISLIPDLEQQFLRYWKMTIFFCFQLLSCLSLLYLKF